MEDSKNKEIKGKKKGIHPNSLKNLEFGKFKKGQVTNPKGRPKGKKNIATILKEKLHKDILVKKGDKEVVTTLADEIVEVLVTKARKGDYKFIDQVLKYESGLPKQEVGVENRHKVLVISPEMQEKYNYEETKELKAGEQEQEIE